MSNRDELVTVDQLAGEIGVDPKTVYRWNAAGRGPRAIKLGGEGRGARYRYRRSDIDAWLERHADPEHADNGPAPA